MKYILNENNVIMGLDVTKDPDTMLTLDIKYGVDKFENGNIIRLNEELSKAESFLNQVRIAEIKLRLNALSQDLVQEMAGEIVPNIDKRKQEFIALHNELRVLEGKEPRLIMEVL